MILKFPHESLKKKAAVVFPDEDISGALIALREAVSEHNGAGLAANQIGIDKQIFVMVDSQKYIRTFLNPQIVKRSAQMAKQVEGCLSFPGKKVRTKRAAHIIVAYHNTGFLECIETLTGNEAIIFQHEFDHLQGKTMLDRETR